MKPWMTGAALTALALAPVALVLGAWQAQPAAPVAPARAPMATGYLTALPNSLTLLPPPPAAGSAAQARDEEANRVAVALHGTPRWDLATQDADLGPNAPATYSCAIGAPISEADTPRLYALMRRTVSDLGRSPYPTKNRYMRARPFTENGRPQCTPAIDAALRKDGSYPSGHAAIGWGWALIVAEVAPEQADAVLARGRAFTESRLVCNVHYPADIEGGRTMGAAVVARLHASPEFRADLDAARAEVAAARAKGLTPSRDCAEEAMRMAAG